MDCSSLVNDVWRGCLLQPGLAPGQRLKVKAREEVEIQIEIDEVLWRQARQGLTLDPGSKASERPFWDGISLDPSKQSMCVGYCVSVASWWPLYLMQCSFLDMTGSAVGRNQTKARTIFSRLIANVP